MEVNKYTVYMHTNKNPSNEGIYKKYIGMTSKKPEYRWGKNGINYGNKNKNGEHTYFYKAILKYGWNNFEHKILIHGLTKEQACSWEQKLIKYYNTNNPKFGYNNTKGGEGAIPTESIKIKLSKTKIGNKNPQAQKVIYIKNGLVYDTITECSNINNIDKSTISNHCRNKLKTKPKYFSYYKDFINLSKEQKEQLTQNIINFESSKKSNTKKIINKHPWNKGLKCPQLSGKNNGMYKIKSNEHPRATKVINLEDNKVFGSIKECANYYKLHVDTIRNHCINKNKKNKFSYYEQKTLT